MSNNKTGLKALLRPEDSIVVLIDHQPYQFANLHSHEPTMIINNVLALAKTAKVFNVPTILSTVLEERGGFIIKGLQDVFPGQKPINRTFINAWEDPKVTDLVKKSGRKQLILAALYTEICLAMPAIQALGEGYDVFIVTDASGGVSAEAHDMAVRRMVEAGAELAPMFQHLNRFALQNLGGSVMYFTLAAARLSRDGRSLEFSSAGHPLPSSFDPVKHRDF